MITVDRPESRSHSVTVKRSPTPRCEMSTYERWAATHALIWWASGDKRLPRSHKRVISTATRPIASSS